MIPHRPGSVSLTLYVDYHPISKRTTVRYHPPSISCSHIARHPAFPKPGPMAPSCLSAGRKDHGHHIPWKSQSITRDGIDHWRSTTMCPHPAPTFPLISHTSITFSLKRSINKSRRLTNIVIVEIPTILRVFGETVTETRQTGREGLCQCC